MNEQTIVTIVSTAVLLWHLLSAGSSYLSDILSQMLPGNKFSRLIDIAGRAVNQVEQQFAKGNTQQWLNSQNKKKEALDSVKLLCEKFGPKFDPDAADKLIEDAVYVLNVSQGKIGNNPTPTTIIPVVKAQQ